MTTGTALELYVPSPLTAALPAAVGVPVQVASLGPNTVKLIVPVAFGPLEPASIAWSEIVPPADACAVACVVTVGEALPTSLVSFGSLHLVMKALLFASPE